MKTLKSPIIPLLLFASAFIVRFALISKGPYHVDCLSSTLYAKQLIETGQFTCSFGFGYPLYIIIDAVSIFLGNLIGINDPFTITNFTSVVFGSLCVLMLYHVTLKLFDFLTAILSALFLTLSPISVAVSVHAFNHTPTLFFLLTAFWAIIRYKETRNNISLLTVFLSLCAMGATRFHDLILLSFTLTFLFFVSFPNIKEPTMLEKSGWKKKTVLFFLFCSGIISIVFIFHLPCFWNKLANYSSSFNSFVDWGIKSNFKGIISSSQLIGLVFFEKDSSILGLILFLIGLILLFKHDRKCLGLLLLWLIIPFLFYGNIYTITPRYLSLLIPAIIWGKSYALAYYLRKNTVMKLAFICILVITIALPFSYLYPKLLARHKHALLPDYARWVGEETEPNAYLITSDDSLFFSHYASINILNRPMNTWVLRDEDLAELKKNIDQFLEQGIPVYITDMGLYAYNPKKKMSNLILKNYNITLIGSRQYESWHTRLLRQKILETRLYRIQPKDTGQ
ncbi:MAG: glycosyltransferase family 39 protein [Candidatus Omnitrophica bacterium]|nr:glycosyltransferase family 39 protein [Candidatus Omnitrophota bacterium]